jgi:D-galactarolactone cycloisomerase
VCATRKVATLTSVLITEIRLQRLRLPLDPPFAAAWDPEPRRAFSATVVQVYTDEGIVGIGSGDDMGGFEDYAHLFLGTDPTKILDQVKRIETTNFHASRYWPLEVAFWDIIGQVCGQPVSVLFGNSKDRLPAYASCGELKPPSARAESAIALRAEGFKALKIRIDRNRIDEGLAAVRATREAVGDTMAIAVDMNQAWRMSGDISPATDVAGARRTASVLRELDVLWMEEPLPYADLNGYQSLRLEGQRVAGGEMMRSLPELLSAIEADAFDVYQPDVVLAVGMLRARMIAELVHAKNRWFTPHSWTNGIGVLANLHVAAGVGGGPFFELPYDPPGWTPQRRDFMLESPLHIDANGDLTVPNIAGLGVKLDHHAMKRCEMSTVSWRAK